MKKRWLLPVLILGISCLAAGCGLGTKSSDDRQEAEMQNENTQKAQSPEKTAEENTEGEGDSGQEQAKPQEFSFADVAGQEFCFSSGAGAWRTVLHIHEDGSFDGQYMDSDLGNCTEEYPGGMAHYSAFSGSFTEPEQVEEDTWRFQIAALEYTYDFGQEIRDGVLYEYTEAYGLSQAEDFYLYLPGKKLADLPEAYRSWVGYYDLDSVEETELPYYGLYNEKQEEGFSSYTRNAKETLDWMEEKKIDTVVSEAQEETARLKEELDNAVTQADMNVISQQLYEVWDGALNEIWGILKENLSESAMAELTEEEREWIQEKERTVQEAGAEVEGGSIYPLIVNGKACEMTQERVYELLSEIYEGF